MEIGGGFGQVIALACVVVAIIIGSIVFGVAKLTLVTKEIRSEVRIEPEIRLTIKDNKVDTLYIYRKK